MRKGILVVIYISAEILRSNCVNNEKFNSIFTETQRGKFYKLINTRVYMQRISFSENNKQKTKNLY